ncbi:hypothetical protein [Acaryochloris sp. IP29b_bin.137]|uniref:hypothetical protein n=1 Tax=Acaryochloris sp. IP29b_bin.137 TaxID=2969217 RepID=UPI0026377BBF|nr:hypothetical protein [Acaryochloris sp. IP29b_bin.137]
MTQINRKLPPQLPPGSLLGLGIGVVIFGVFWGAPHLLIRQRFQQGQQAYEQAQCQIAIQKFDQVIAMKQVMRFGDYQDRATVKKAECEYYLSGLQLQSQGQHEAALHRFTNLVIAYKTSPLISPAQANITNLFEQAIPKDLATERVCERLETLINHKMIPHQDTDVSQFYVYCGQRYEQKQQYARAKTLYEKSQQQYPQKSDLWTPALARVTVANIKQNGAKQIDFDQRVGSTTDGSSKIELKNSSPRQVWITVSGPTPQFKTLPPCKKCKIYNQRIESCPAEGAFTRISLEPGEHDISVQFTELPGEKIVPWAGSLQLQTGAHHSRCFFLVRHSSGQRFIELEKPLEKPSL